MRRFGLLFILLFLLSVVSYGQTVRYYKYTVRKKATPSTIAFLNDITVEQLLKANPSLNPSAKIKPGVQLNIPEQIQDKEETVPEVVEPQSNIETIVKEDVKEETAVLPVEKEESGDPFIEFDSNNGTIVIAALLPFENQQLSQSMVEFYSGMVIAASDAKEINDVDVQIKVYSTTSIPYDKLASSDVIIGPVHEESFKKVASWAKQHHKPIISPLSSFEVPDNHYVIMMPPVQQTKLEPLSSYLTSDKNVLLIEHASYTNKSLENEFLKIAPEAKKIHYVREDVTPQILAPLMDTNKENVVLVPTDHQGAIEDILSKLTAINSPVKTCKISVVGSSAWLNFSNFTQDLLFRGNVSCISSYYYDRSDKVVSTLFEDYIDNFERIPNKFAMRGYDIIDIIVSSLHKWGREALINMPGEKFVPLQTPYLFEKNEANGNIQNTSWVLVSYNEDYSVSIL